MLLGLLPQRKSLCRAGKNIDLPARRFGPLHASATSRQSGVSRDLSPSVLSDLDSKKLIIWSDWGDSGALKGAQIHPCQVRAPTKCAFRESEKPFSPHRLLRHYRPSSETTAGRGFATRCHQGRDTLRSSGDHIYSDRCSHLHSRDGSLHESSSCNRPALGNSRCNRSSRHDRHMSLGSRNASDPAGPLVRRGIPPHNRSSPLAGAHSRRIDSFRSSGRHDGNDSSEPCRSTHRDCNRGHDRSGH